MARFPVTTANLMAITFLKVTAIRRFTLKMITSLSARARSTTALSQFHRAVIEGNRELSYQLFLGLSQDCDLDRLEEQVLYTTLIDVQDSLTMRRNRNNQHKALLARSLFDLGCWVGWERAHPLIYTIVPDLACGPRYYSVYDMVGMSGEMNLVNEDKPQTFSLSDSGTRLVSAVGVADPWARLRENTLPLTDKEMDETIDIVMHADNYYQITDHLIERLQCRQVDPKPRRYRHPGDVQLRLRLGPSESIWRSGSRHGLLQQCQLFHSDFRSPDES